MNKSEYEHISRESLYKRIKELESAMQEFVDWMDTDGSYTLEQFANEVYDHSDKFKQLLDDKCECEPFQSC